MDEGGEADEKGAGGKEGCIKAAAAAAAVAAAGAAAVDGIVAIAAPSALVVVHWATDDRAATSGPFLGYTRYVMHSFVQRCTSKGISDSEEECWEGW